MGNSLEFSTPCFQLASPTLVLAVLLGATILYISYINFTTSLRRIPGPFLAKYSKLWLVHVTRQRKRHFHDIELHEKYGPIVRVSPTQVSLASPQAVKIVYGSVTRKPLEKDHWYQILSPPAPEGLDLLSEQDMQKYRLQRRMIGPIYSASSILDIEKPLDSILINVLASMRYETQRAVDLDFWSHTLALDCLTAAVFGKSIDLITSGSDDGSVRTIIHGWKYMHWASHVPWLHKLNVSCMKLTGHNIWGGKIGRGPPIFEWAASQLNILRASPQKSSVMAANLAAKLINLHHSNPLFTSRYLADMTFSNFGAGTETIGIILSAVLCNVIQRPDLQSKLHKEIDDAHKEKRLAFSSENIIKIGDAPKELRLLEATLRESMRLHPVVGVPFPRVVGKGGLVVDGVLIPEGTTVGINPWVMGRNRELYGTDAADFKPERWLSMSREERIRIDTFDQTFGLGVHSCPGKHLARAILYKILPMLLTHFTWDFEGQNGKMETECMFGVRWKDVKVIWSRRTIS